jgi:hypothetical protein
VHFYSAVLNWLFVQPSLEGLAVARAAELQARQRVGKQAFDYWQFGCP